jgi:superfamily I DNA/RNA helicase
MTLSGIKKTSVLKESDKVELCELLNLDFSCYENHLSERVRGQDTANVLFYLYDFIRNSKKSKEEVFEFLAPEISMDTYNGFVRNYELFKKTKSLVDYTDLLSLYLSVGSKPINKHIFIDEAQDLTTLQWDVVEKLSEKCLSLTVAGDDDQAIYAWNGADLERFVHQQGYREVLNQSYRLKPAVFCFSRSIITKVHERVPKSFKPLDSDSGGVYEISDLFELPLEKGQWLLLARNNYFLSLYVNHCLENGYLYEKDGWYKGKKELRAIRTWIKIVETQAPCTTSELELLNEYSYHDLTESKLLKGSWQNALQKMDIDIFSYYSQCEQNGEKLYNPARIRIETIHGAKGLEATNVCIMPDMTFSTFQAYENSTVQERDDEHRVFYVAATRAKENLFLLAPSTRYYYELHS